ncbi:MAG: 3-dehydroquinate synthase [Treponema sp.]|nr:3-dehydroquinate synthase [Treponema sp.]
METSTFTINYPAICAGTEKSAITFYDGTPDLVSLYKPGEDKGARYFFITDATVGTLPCMEPFVQKFDDGKCGNDSLLILGSGEKYKTIDTVLEIIRTGLEHGFNRKDIFVGIGGGVICDITAFAASVFKRGVKVEFVPTTLLAMVDASVGGKTGCDFENYKNMIGSFYPAAKLSYFPEFIQYLPENQFKSGLGEVLKTAVLFNKDLYNLLKNDSEKVLSRDKETLKQVISACVEAKGKIVEEDFTEKGERAFLNLGHTFGHAYETICGLGNVTHGEAVAWGMGRMVALSAYKDFCMDSYKMEIFGLLEKYGFDTSSVPQRVRGGGIGERFIDVMRIDKKNETNKIRVILQKGLCDTFISEIEDKDILYIFR